METKELPTVLKQEFQEAIFWPLVYARIAADVKTTLNDAMIWAGEQLLAQKKQPIAEKEIGFRPEGIPYGGVQRGTSAILQIEPLGNGEISVAINHRPGEKKFRNPMIPL